jgi:hypothetical protein
MCRLEAFGSAGYWPAWRLFVSLLVASAGCADATVASSPTELQRSECPAGQLSLEGGDCRPAGLPPDLPCPLGEHVRHKGGSRCRGFVLACLDALSVERAGEVVIR